MLGKVWKKILRRTASSKTSYSRYSFESREKACDQRNSAFGWMAHEDPIQVKSYVCVNAA
jgi:hypothetical protein